MPGLRDYVEMLMRKGEKSSSFAKWAFGEDYNEIDGAGSFANSWNNLHSDLFEINLNGQISEDIIKMVNLWREFGRN